MYVCKSLVMFAWMRDRSISVVRQLLLLSPFNQRIYF